MRTALSLTSFAVLCGPAFAGLHYSGESYRELPARWRGYLPDHRALRSTAGAQFRTGGPAAPLRDQYADAALKLETATKSRELTADELADLGALYVRLGQAPKAIELLRPAVRKHPEHFRIAANLGTAWQYAGDLEQASAMLEDAVRLAPANWKDAERLHLRLVQLRAKEGKQAKEPQAPDDLFGVRFRGPDGKASPGGLDPVELKKLPANDVALVQQLALWLPGDGRLLWLLAELANAHGDVRTAANILDGCVTEFALAADDVRTRRTLYRTAADDLENRTGHQTERGTIAFKSSRALARGLDPSRLPTIQPDGVNALPWPAVGETELGPKLKPIFLKYLDDLDGKRVTLTGYITPVGNAAAELTGFLFTEFPVGCWFCEIPGPSQVIAVDLVAGTTTEPSRAVVRITATLKLNRADPERFPVTLTDARVGPAD